MESNEVTDAAAWLIPFPIQAKATDLHPGEWGIPPRATRAGDPRFWPTDGTVVRRNDEECLFRSVSWG